MVMPTTKHPRLIPYQTLRQAIGWLGILLPAAMIIGNWFMHNCTTVQSSISHYYYTITGQWLVGILCAVAMFLISYRGYELKDNITSSIAGFTAIAIAFFPTNTATMVPEKIIMNECLLFSLRENGLRNTVHYAGACLFFFSLAYMSLFLFTKSNGVKTKEKITRNKVFISCGIIILLSILLVGLYGFFGEGTGLKKYKPVFWLEWIALFAFGISWLVKGEIVLKDDSLDKK